MQVLVGYGFGDISGVLIHVYLNLYNRSCCRRPLQLWWHQQTPLGTMCKALQTFIMEIYLLRDGCLTLPCIHVAGSMVYSVWLILGAWKFFSNVKGVVSIPMKSLRMVVPFMSIAPMCLWTQVCHLRSLIFVRFCVQRSHSCIHLQLSEISSQIFQQQLKISQPALCLAEGEKKHSALRPLMGHFQFFFVVGCNY